MPLLIAPMANSRGQTPIRIRESVDDCDRERNPTTPTLELTPLTPKPMLSRSFSGRSAATQAAIPAGRSAPGPKGWPRNLGHRLRKRPWRARTTIIDSVN
jgi:hypothetical protein